jgi:2-C-methyl-D-erythritol 2,4-cyclodiphosphate synthase
MRKKGAKLINADLTIICENPKISKYKSQMEESLAATLNSDKSRINVKATTAERMGSLGRE